MINRLRIKQNVLLPAAVFLILVSGCSTGTKQYIRPDVDPGKISRIAILPLMNYTRNNFSDEKIGSLLIIDLLARGKNVVEPGEVINALRELRIRSAGPLSAEEIQNIGELLEVEALITGSVSAFEMKKGISVTYPEVSVYLSMYDAATGDIIWSVWHTTGGAGFWARHFGAEDTTLDETARNVVKQAVDTLF